MTRDDQISSELLQPVEEATEEILKTHPHRVTVFYRNDVEGGISTTKAYPSLEGLFGFYDALCARMLILDGTVKDPQEIFDGLDKIGLNIAEMPALVHAVALDFIFWLESRGHLKADQFNGCVWEWETGVTRIVHEGANPGDLRPRRLDVKVADTPPV